MKIVIAPQSFKGTATASVVAGAMLDGVKKVMPSAEVISMPIADGGSGTVDTLVKATNGITIETPAVDPIGRPIIARWGVLGDGKTAVIETSAASGLSLLDISEYDPDITTTRGTGMLLRAAIDSGYSNILLGVGDSATNDGGVGLARALGIRPLDKFGKELPEGGAALSELESFDIGAFADSLLTTNITVLCDVTNPLCGINGASAVYGPQKGASHEQIESLDKSLLKLAQVVKNQLGEDILDVPGAGAGGGLGAGLIAFCGATLRPGFEIISEAVGLQGLLNGADMVLTGEGRIDSQTLLGKGLAGVASLSKSSSVNVVAAVVGANGLSDGEAISIGIDYVVPLIDSFDWKVPSPEETPILIEYSTIVAINTALEGIES
ncbi:MAG: glycerate kinase [SAR202 cluster bacterium]|nr:glycerate kinase [SAR202 cluster bacterium]|tara:strand:- start:14 stop:1156 length:1143 start_codon:yes stop_codon:yes gene_type:complete